MLRRDKLASCVPSRAGSVYPIDPHNGCPTYAVLLGRGIAALPKKGVPCSTIKTSFSCKKWYICCQKRFCVTICAFGLNSSVKGDDSKINGLTSRVSLLRCSIESLKCCKTSCITTGPYFLSIIFTV